MVAFAYVYVWVYVSVCLINFLILKFYFFNLTEIHKSKKTHLARAYFFNAELFRADIDLLYSLIER